MTARDLLAGLAEAWPPPDAEGGAYRRTSLAATRLVAAIALPLSPDAPRGTGDLLRPCAVALAREEGDAAPWTVAPMVQDPAAPGGWRRAAAGDGAAAALVRALGRPGARPGGFHVTGDPGGAPGGAGARERAMGVDQTNESVVVDERLVVKWLLHPDPARERAPRLLRHLSAAGFRETPPVSGTLVWVTPGDDTRMTLAVVDAWLPGARDGWQWCTEAVLEHVAPGHRCAADCPARFAGDLGALVARLHVALATPTAVIPEPVAAAGGEAIAAWAAAARASLEDATALTAADDAEAGAELARAAEALGARLATLTTIGSTPVMPIHGDLHVGQVLRGPHGLAVIDLDGNPTLDAATVRAPAPPARDVAGMACSLDHVGRVAIRRGGDAAATQSWIAEATATLLAAYRESLARGGHPELLDERLLAPFAVEQECRELIYAARFLPRWRYAPMGAIRAMVAG